MDTLLQDIRYAIRALLRTPSFTAVAVGTLALGLGASTAVFSVLDGVILRPLPATDPGALVHLARAFPQPAGGEHISWNYSYPGYTDLRDAGIFAGVIAHTPAILAIGDGSAVDRVESAAVSAGFFTTLGVPLASGRDILPDEDRPGASQPVVILSDDLWRGRFGADPRILSRVVTINGRPFTVIGVAAPEFTGLQLGLRQQAWIPVTGSTDAGDNTFGRRTVSWLDVLARLKPSGSQTQASAGLAVLQRRLQAAATIAREERFVVVDGSRGLDFLVAGLARAISVLMAAVVLVLVVVWANVAGLLLARGAARQREIAIRLAVGAGRGRLVRQLATESLVLALLGGVAGLVVATWITDLVPSIPTLFSAPLALPRGFDARVLGFTALATALTALGFGLVPALQTSRPDLVEALRGTAAPPARGRFRFSARDALVTGQVALSLILLSGAGLLFRTARNLQAVDPGFDPSNVLLAGVDFDYRGYTGVQARAFWADLLARMRATPGVADASMTVTVVPSPGGSRWDGVPLEGVVATPEHPVEFDVNRVGPGYFATLRIPVLAGREFDKRDQAGAPRVAVINETMARRYWPDQDPIGRRMWLGADTTAPSARIVGIVRDGKYRSLREDPVSVVYWSALQGTSPIMTLILRARTAPLALVGAVRSAVHEIDPGVPVFDVRTLETHVDLGAALGGVGAAAATRLLRSFLYGVGPADPLAFGGAALLLVITGIAAAYLPARRAARVDPTVALRSE